MADPLLVADNITIKVPVIHPEDRIITSNPIQFLTDIYLSRTKRGVVQILDKVSFSLYPGMRVGLIGANGAGKSTLLRVLAGIYAPTTGKLVVNGSAKGLFDISLGMNKEATGLENIYMRGLQMGLHLHEIKELIPEALEFSELKENIHLPYNAYSSGMRLRLAVSISTMIQPDILLLDEWIGTGDISFRAKVKDRMNSLIEQSRGLVIASHNDSLIGNLCSHGLVLSKGKLIFWGEVDDALKFYHSAVVNKNEKTIS